MNFNMLLPLPHAAACSLPLVAILASTVAPDVSRLVLTAPVRPGYLRVCRVLLRAVTGLPVVDNGPLDRLCLERPGAVVLAAQTLVGFVLPMALVAAVERASKHAWLRQQRQQRQQRRERRQQRHLQGQLAGWQGTDAATAPDADADAVRPDADASAASPDAAAAGPLPPCPPGSLLTDAPSVGGSASPLPTTGTGTADLRPEPVPAPEPAPGVTPRPAETAHGSRSGAGAGARPGGCSGRDGVP